MLVFQPVVALPDERVVGFEALAQWPMFATVTPQNLFSFANASRRADALDQQCVDAAVRAALELAGQARHDGDQRFEFLITSARALVTRAARSLLSRVL